MDSDICAYCGAPITRRYPRDKWQFHKASWPVHVEGSGRKRHTYQICRTQHPSIATEGGTTAHGVTTAAAASLPQIKKVA